MLFVAAVMAAGLGADNGPVEVHVLRTVTVFEAEEHLNFPWAYRGPGSLLALNCSIGRHTVSEHGMGLVSDDDGQTWAKPKEPALGGMGTLLRDGRGVVLQCWGPDANDDGSYPATTVFSADGGRTVTERVGGVLTLPFVMKPHFHRSIVELPDGSLVATIYGTREGHTKYTSALVRTEDGGNHWAFRSVMAHSEEVGREGFCEPALARLANGDLLCALRTGGPLYTVRSTDDGQTWDEPCVVADHGVDPALLVMKNGALVLSYGRPNVDLLISGDGSGAEWDGPFTVYRGPGCHYTSLVEAVNGDLMLFFSQSGFCGAEGTGPLNMMRLARIAVGHGRGQ
ncbi:MAG: exo-alpha-sialidase [Candidatus Hydrogenedentes bacterium]|nr:exo-alpha-sialidase [Candidatus Hydrogenedentota bacterium]